MIDVHVRDPQVFRELGVQRKVNLAGVLVRIHGQWLSVAIQQSWFEPLDDKVEREADGELEIVDFNDLEILVSPQGDYS